MNQIIGLVESKLGLKLRSLSESFWHEKLYERIKICNLATEQEYYSLLLQSSEEMQALIELTVIPETWFFRDRGVFDFLTDLIKKEIVQPRSSPFKILSLACSTGEEPYSIVMTLLDAGLTKEAFNVDAADISMIALKKAQDGIYRLNSFRGEDLSFRDHYFKKIDERYEIDEQVKRQVCFYHLNLLTENFPFKLHSYDLIFCRNLLIYLAPIAQDHMIQQVKELLSPEGYFAVGPAETQIVFNAGFAPVDSPNTYTFRLKEELIPDGEVRNKNKTIIEKTSLSSQPFIEKIKKKTIKSNSSALNFFSRRPSQDYIEEWTEALKKPTSAEKKKLDSVMVFRLGKEWLALPTNYFKEIKRPRAVHSIPHRSGQILLGIVDINGVLQICIDLHKLLQIEPDPSPHLALERMIVLVKEGNVWTFLADEIEGIFNWDFSELENVPVNVSKSKVNYVKGIMKLESKSVGLLDHELLFSSLARRLE